jgi:hypothetical protein
MPDRSSYQGLPEDWNHGSHAARGPFSAPETANGYGAEPTGSHRARPADAYMTRPADVHSAVTADALRAREDSYGAADPFGHADPFGPRAVDPFGPAVTAAFGTVTDEAGTARPDTERPATTIGGPATGRAADSRGFVGALFDFGFTSFVTPKVIKVLYILIVIGTVVSALVFTLLAFKASTAFGILTLVFGDPLFILIVLAIYRVVLEFFMVTFRVAEDIRALRERGDLR